MVMDIPAVHYGAQGLSVMRQEGWMMKSEKCNWEVQLRMDIPAAHNGAQGLSVMRSAPKLRPWTEMSGLVLPSCAQRRP